MRVGWGFDVHRFASEGGVLLAGVLADSTRGIEATSDGDVVAHALIDALLGAAGLGDIGLLYPSSDPQWAGADSMLMLDDTVQRLSAAGFAVRSADVTVIAETVRVAPIRREMQAALAAVLHAGAVSVKATTTDGLGFTGRDEGIAAQAAVVVEALG